MNFSIFTVNDFAEFFCCEHTVRIVLKVHMDFLCPAIMGNRILNDSEPDPGVENFVSDFVKCVRVTLFDSI